MNTSTKQFAWKDRDTSTSDLLQLVYHAPPYISSLSARLLSAFRSNAFVPQFRDIALDESLDGWVRMYALRACSNVPAEILIEDFAKLIREAIETHGISDRPIIMNGKIMPNFIHDIAEFVDKKPRNRQWFLKVLDNAPPPIIKKIVFDTFSFHHSNDFRITMTGYLIRLLEDKPNLLDVSLVSKLFDLESEETQIWLDNRFDEILALCLKNPESYSVISIARDWAKLRKAIQNEVEDWYVDPPLPRLWSQSDCFKFSPVYLALFDLYQNAKNLDSSSYGKLLSLARKWQGNIAIRAVATHWIGKLGDNYNVFPILAHLMRYGDAKRSLELFDSPLRYEAGEALLQFKTPETWEVYIDSCFINPNDDLLSFQEAWIEYMTDVLSGVNRVYDGYRYGAMKRRWWFRELENLSVDELEDTEKKF